MSDTGYRVPLNAERMPGLWQMFHCMHLPDHSNPRTTGAELYACWHGHLTAFGVGKHAKPWSKIKPVIKLEESVGAFTYRDIPSHSHSWNH